MQHLRRQVVELHLRPVAEHHRALDHVAELADVARPAVALQDRQRIGGDAIDPPADLIADSMRSRSGGSSVWITDSR
jgi:hypothetical protein